MWHNVNTLRHTPNRDKKYSCAKSSTHHTQVFGHSKREQTHEVKENKGAASKSFAL